MTGVPGRNRSTRCRDASDTADAPATRWPARLRATASAVPTRPAPTTPTSSRAGCSWPAGWRCRPVRGSLHRRSSSAVMLLVRPVHPAVRGPARPPCALPEHPAGSGRPEPQPGPRLPGLGVPLPGVARPAASRRHRSRRAASAPGSSAPGTARPRPARARRQRRAGDPGVPGRHRLVQLAQHVDQVAASAGRRAPPRPPSSPWPARRAWRRRSAPSAWPTLRPVSRLRTFRPIDRLGERQRRQRGDGGDRQQRQAGEGGPHRQPGDDRADREDAGERAGTGHVHGRPASRAGARRRP